MNTLIVFEAQTPWVGVVVVVVLVCLCCWQDPNSGAEDSLQDSVSDHSKEPTDSDRWATLENRPLAILSAKDYNTQRINDVLLQAAEG